MQQGSCVVKTTEPLGWVLFALSGIWGYFSSLLWASKILIGLFFLAQLPYQSQVDSSGHQPEQVLGITLQSCRKYISI